MIDSISLMNDGLNIELTKTKYMNVSPMSDHLGILLKSEDKIVAVFSRKEIAIIARYLNDFLADENNK